ncbi:MAG: hypothetical protein IT368_04570 [Candidatus Hydrogenedentes bacterium]|nr:hypothetical protein [Candidatus Hydrogenedentota bacterium]
MRVSRGFILCLFLLLVAALLLFGWTVHERAPWFGMTPIGISGWNTAGTALVASHWYREGALDLVFGMYWTPASIETPQEARDLYVSYPPGAVLPVYLISLFAGSRPSPEMVMGWNLFVHFLTAILLGAALYVLCARYRLPAAATAGLSAAPCLVYLFAPSPYYEHLMGYFADQAVMAPFAAYLLVEVFRWGRAEDEVSWRVETLQGAIALYGCLTDWLFYFLILCTFLARLIRGRLGNRPITIIRRTALMAAPAALALALFALQLWRLGAFDRLLHRAAFRSGLAQSNSILAPPGDGGILHPLSSFFWQRHIPTGFGEAGKILILIASGALLLALLGAAAAWTRRRPLAPSTVDAVSFLWLLAAPSWLYLLAVPGHNNMILHFFTALKFAPLLAAGSFGALPLAAAAALGRQRASLVPAGLAFLTLAASILYCWSVAPQRARLFEAIDTSDDLQHLGRFIGAQASDNDVLFSPTLVVEGKPPQRMYHAMKEVHPAQTWADMTRILKKITGDYRVGLLLERERTPQELPNPLQQFAQAATRIVASGDFKIYWMPKAAFLDLLPTQNIN